MLKSYVRKPTVLMVKIKGPCEVTDGDIETNENVEILNPDHHIATLANDGKLEMELEVRTGRGFCLAELNKRTIMK